MSAPVKRSTDVVVVGLGAHGAATLYQLAKRGVDVIGLDRFVPPHDRGSSHGGSRLTREAVGEGAAYVPLARRAHKIIAELEAEFGETLLVKSGMLIVGSPLTNAAPLHGAKDFLAVTIAMAEQFQIPHEMLDAAALRRRFPQFLTFKDTDRGYFEPQSGYLRPEALIATQLAAARKHGATVRDNVSVTSIEQTGDGVTIHTSEGAFTARQVVVAAGAWTRKLLGAPFDSLLTVTRQLLHWYEAESYEPFTPARLPAFIWFVTDRLEDYFTGFAVTDPSEGIKMVASRDGPAIDPETVVPATEAESQEFYDLHVGPNMAGITRKVLKSATCFYTETPDHGFIIDRHPAMDKVLVVSACSGHGFKHSAAIGEAVAETIHDGASRIDLSAFSLARFETPRA